MSLLAITVVCIFLSFFTALISERYRAFSLFAYTPERYDHCTRFSHLFNSLTWTFFISALLSALLYVIVFCR